MSYQIKIKEDEKTLKEMKILNQQGNIHKNFKKLFERVETGVFYRALSEINNYIEADEIGRKLDLEVEIVPSIIDMDIDCYHEFFLVEHEYYDGKKEYDYYRDDDYEDDIWMGYIYTIKDRTHSDIIREFRLRVDRHRKNYRELGTWGLEPTKRENGYLKILSDDILYDVHYYYDYSEYLNLKSKLNCSVNNVFAVLFRDGNMITRLFDVTGSIAESHEEAIQWIENEAKKRIASFQRNWEEMGSYDPL